MGYEGKLQRQEYDLYIARRAVIDLLPEAARLVIDTYHRSSTPTERYEWERDIIEAILELAVEIEPANLYGRPRGYCPLCNRGSSGPYESGFSLPEGLKRHLTGWGNTRQCVVIEIASGLAHEAWERTRRQVSDDLNQERADQVAHRRTVESQYLIAPNMPVLFDEDIWFSTVRTDAEILFAERRLESLGFAREVNGLIRSYTRRFESDLVFADPRRAGRIDFRVFHGEVSRSQARLEPTFYISDRWKNDLETKLVERVRAATSGRR